MNGRSGVAVSGERSMDRSAGTSTGLSAGLSAGVSARVTPGGPELLLVDSRETDAGSVRVPAAPGRVVRPRPSAGRVAPQPTGPGRVGSRSGRRAPARPMSARRPGVSSGPQSRAVAGRMRPAPSSVAGGAAGWRGVAALVVAGLAAALAVFGLGSLADAMASARVPEATGPVVVRADETLLQLAHRAAPSADPTAVVHRIATLNDLRSPSVEPGQVLVSPIG